MRRIAIIAVLLASITQAACASDPSTASPAQVCSATARDYSGTVVGAFDTTVGAIRGLDQGQVDPPRWPDVSPEHSAVLCYIDAQIAKAPPPGPNGEVSRPFDRAIVSVVDGKSEMIMAGYRDQLPVPSP
jgi:hypothetical protein